MNIRKAKAIIGLVEGLNSKEKGFLKELLRDNDSGVTNVTFQVKKTKSVKKKAKQKRSKYSKEQYKLAWSMLQDGTKKSNVAMATGIKVGTIYNKKYVQRMAERE